MSQAKLKEQIKNIKFDNVLVFFGKEDYLREYYLDQVIKKILNKDFFDFNLHIFDAQKIDISLFSSITQSYPVMSDKRVIIINDLKVQSLKAELKKELEELFLDFPDYLMLIFNYADNEYEPQKKEEFKKLFKGALFVNFEKPKEDDLVVWVIRHFNSQKKKVDKDIVYYFLSVCPNEMNILKSEIEKICNYSKGEQISKEDIDNLSTKSLSSTVFLLGDALLSKDFSKAYLILDNLLTQKNEPIAIIAYLISVFINLLKLKCANIEGVVFDIASSEIGINRYVASKYQRHINKFDKAYIKKIIIECKNTDLMLKSSKVDKEDQIFILIGKIINMAGRK